MQHAHSGHQIKIHTVEGDYLYQDGKVYKSVKTARNAIAKIVLALDDGTLSIPNFSYCEIVDWTSSDELSYVHPYRLN